MVSAINGISSFIPTAGQATTVAGAAKGEVRSGHHGHGRAIAKLESLLQDLQQNDSSNTDISSLAGNLLNALEKAAGSSSASSQSANSSSSQLPLDADGDHDGSTAVQAASNSNSSPNFQKLEKLLEKIQSDSSINPDIQKLAGSLLYALQQNVVYDQQGQQVSGGNSLLISQSV